MSDLQDELIVTMKRVASTLKHAGIPFALAGSAAAYARGSTPGEHDIDFALTQADIPRAVDALDDVGLSVVRPPEDWLVKVYDDDRMVDLIFRLNDRPVSSEMLARADSLEVDAVRMPVLSATDLVTHKLLALSAHHCDYSPALILCRALREQVDWDRVRDDVAESPYAQAFLVLVQLLDIADVFGEEVPWETLQARATTPTARDNSKSASALTSARLSSASA